MAAWVNMELTPTNVLIPCTGELYVRLSRAD